MKTTTVDTSSLPPAEKSTVRDEEKDEPRQRTGWPSRNWATSKPHLIGGLTISHRQHRTGL